MMSFISNAIKNSELWALVISFALQQNKYCITYLSIIHIDFCFFVYSSPPAPALARESPNLLSSDSRGFFCTVNIQVSLHRNRMPPVGNETCIVCSPQQRSMLGCNGKSHILRKRLRERWGMLIGGGFSKTFWHQHLKTLIMAPKSPLSNL